MIDASILMDRRFITGKVKNRNYNTCNTSYRKYSGNDVEWQRCKHLHLDFPLAVRDNLRGQFERNLAHVSVGWMYDGYGSSDDSLLYHSLNTKKQERKHCDVSLRKRKLVGGTHLSKQA